MQGGSHWNSVNVSAELISAGSEHVQADGRAVSAGMFSHVNSDPGGVKKSAVTVTVRITRITRKIITNGPNGWRSPKSTLPHSVHLARQPRGTAPVHYGKSIE